MTRIEIATRLYAAAISNAELVNQTAEQLRHASIAQADILLAECGEGEAAQPRKVEVTPGMIGRLKHYDRVAEYKNWNSRQWLDYIINGGDV